jgi:hypothetical protein
MRGLVDPARRPIDGTMPQRRLEVVPLSRHRWVVRLEGDPTPLSQATTLTEARAEARNQARLMGVPGIVVHELDGECHIEHISLGYRTPPLAEVERRPRRT